MRVNRGYHHWEHRLIMDKYFFIPHWFEVIFLVDKSVVRNRSYPEGRAQEKHNTCVLIFATFWLMWIRHRMIDRFYWFQCLRHYLNYLLIYFKCRIAANFLQSKKRTMNYGANNLFQNINKKEVSLQNLMFKYIPSQLTKLNRITKVGR